MMGRRSQVCCALTTLAVIGSALDEKTPSVGKLRASADEAHSKGDFDGALRLLSQVVQMEPDNERNFYKRYRVYLRRAQYREALADLDAALRVQPSYAVARAQRAKLLLMLGRCELAANDYEAAALDEIETAKKKGAAAEASAATQAAHQKAIACSKHVVTAHAAAKKKDWRSAHEEYTSAIDLTEARQGPGAGTRTSSPDDALVPAHRRAQVAAALLIERARCAVEVRRVGARSERCGRTQGIQSPSPPPLHPPLPLRPNRHVTRALARGLGC